MKYPQFPTNSMMVRKHKGQLEMLTGINYESRNESTAKLISTANYIYSFKDFDWIFLNTGDTDEWESIDGYPIYSYCNAEGDYSRTIPDFIFDGWPQTQLNDYEHTCREIAEFGNHSAENDKLGWRGALTHPNRNNLLKFKNSDLYDIEEIIWDRSNPHRLVSHNFVSIEESVRKWRYLIDVEGNGWSARMKLFLFSKRVLFLQDRPYKEWFYPKMIPMQHFIPVNRDLSDLEEKLDMVRSDPELERYIANSAYKFAINNVSRKNAVERWGEIINGL